MNALTMPEQVALVGRMGDLEKSIIQDMLDNGIDPWDDNQVNQYWRDRLDDV